MTRFNWRRFNAMVAGGSIAACVSSIITQRPVNWLAYAAMMLAFIVLGFVRR